MKQPLFCWQVTDLHKANQLSSPLLLPETEAKSLLKTKLMLQIILKAFPNNKRNKSYQDKIQLIDNFLMNGSQLTDFLTFNELKNE